jgi:hypothetical protein
LNISTCPSFLVIIDQINLAGILAVEREHQPPIARHPHRPLPFAIALKLVKPMAWSIQVFRAFRRVKGAEEPTQFGGVLGVDAPRRPCHEELLKPLTAEGFDRTPISVT